MRHFPNITQALGLLLLFVLLQILFAFPLGVFALATKSNITNNPLTIAAVNLLSIGLLLRFGLMRSRASWQEVFPFSPMRAALLLPMALIVIGLSILLSEVDNRLRTVLPVPGWLTEVLQNLFGVPQNFLSSIFTLVIVAPLTEELLFRGLILRGFLSHYSVRKAIMASALFFAVFHFNPWQFTGAFVLGAIFAWWFVKTRSLLPCLFGHALNNGVPVILLALPLMKIPGYSTELTDQVEFQPLWFDLLGFALAGLGFWRLRREFAKCDDRRSGELLGPQMPMDRSDNGQREGLS
jgi:hypothetical protein